MPPTHQSSVSSSQQDDYKEIKLAFFWIGSFFLLQSLVFAVTAKKIFFPEPETYWFMVLLERLLFPFMALNTLVIVASDPFSDFKIIEIISVVMLLLSRSSSLLSDEANYATETEIGAYPGFLPGMVEVAGYTYFFFMALRYKKLLLKETVGTVRTLVYNTLPKIITSAILSMAYMNSDSIQCVLSNMNEPVTPSDGVVLCTDLNLSTKPMNNLILLGVVLTLFVLPTDKNDYSMKSFVKFSFSFGHQILVVCVAVSLFVALYLYSTMRSDNEIISVTSGYEKIDDWFSSPRLESYPARVRLSILSGVFAFAPVAVVVNENVRLPKCTTSFASSMQRSLSTKKTNRFAQSHRFFCFVSQLLICLPLYGFWYELNKGHKVKASEYYDVINLFQLILLA